MLEAVFSRLTWQSVAQLGVAVVIYLFTVAFYRLYLHPLAKFPGPKLAAVTRWYEAYYDVWQEGQYEFRIQDMHKKYGPIVRISPYELHIKDSTYHEELFRFGGTWNKYDWQVKAHGAVFESALFTPEHDLHKQRRAPLNSFFSKARVAKHLGLIRGTIAKLCAVLENVEGSGRVIDMGAAVSAWQRDLSCEFLLDTRPNNLDQADLGRGITTFIEATAKIWRRTKHFRWFGPLLMSIPRDVLVKYSGDEKMVNWFNHVANMENQTRRLMDEAAQSSPERERKDLTIVHEIVWDTRLPQEEKTFKRVFDEVASVTGAAFETTASVMRVIIYHVWNDPKIIGRLRAELADAAAAAATKGDDSHAEGLSSAQPLDLRSFEQLPYLTGILEEGFRMSPGLISRMHRIAPDRDLVYKEWRIPAGTPVGMTTLDMHMDEEYYPEPKRFAPERWVDPVDRKRLEKVYMPFSRGARNCLGMYFAWAELYLVVAELAQRFDFQFHDVKDNHFEYDSDQFTVSIYGGAVLKATVKAFQRGEH